MTAPTTAAPLGLRARKKRQTFQALQSNARRLVVERGLAGVTVEDIAAAAEVSKRTFFNYFESKEAAIVDAEPGVTEQLRAALCARPESESPLQALRVAAVEVLVEQAPGLQELAGLVAANPVLALRQAAAFAMFHDVIVAWAAERTGCDPDKALIRDPRCLIGQNPFAFLFLVCQASAHAGLSAMNGTWSLAR